MRGLRLVILFTCGFIAYTYAQSNLLAMQAAQNAADSNKGPGQPQFSVNGGGSGNNRNNWQAGGNANLGTKVWESNNGRHSVGAGVSAGQQFGRYQGQQWKSKPDVGAGVGYRFKFGK